MMGKTRGCLSELFTHVSTRLRIDVLDRGWTPFSAAPFTDNIDTYGISYRTREIPKTL